MNMLSFKQNVNKFVLLLTVGVSSVVFAEESFLSKIDELAQIEYAKDVKNSALSYKKRAEALEKITNIEILSDIAQKDKDVNIRSKAIEKDLPENVLISISQLEGNQKLRLQAINKVSDQNALMKYVNDNRNHFNDRVAMLHRITNIELLSDIAQKDKDVNIRSKAIEKDLPENVLISISQLEGNQKLRLQAINKVSDQNALMKYVNDNRNHFNDRVAMLHRITNIELLSDIAQKDKDVNIRSKAIEKDLPENVLISISQLEGNQKLRLQAINKVSDQNALMKYVNDNRNHFNDRVAMLHRITNIELLSDIAQKDKDVNIRSKAIEKDLPENVLISISQLEGNQKLRLQAINKVSDQNALMKYVNDNRNHFNNRVAVLNRITEQPLLAEIALTVEDVNIRKKVIPMLTLEDVLEQIQEEDNSKAVREAAKRRLDVL